MKDIKFDEEHKPINPLNEYGFGVVAYFKFLKNLAKIYFFISLWSIIIIWIYKNSESSARNSNFIFASMTLGNFKSVQSNCQV